MLSFVRDQAHLRHEIRPLVKLVLVVMVSKDPDLKQLFDHLEPYMLRKLSFSASILNDNHLALHEYLVH